MAKTIQGKPEEEIQRELMNLLTTDDYSIMEGTGKPYFKAETLMSKVRSLLGFNWETEPVVLNSDGDLYRIKEELGQVSVSVKIQSVIRYDDGEVCNRTSEVGIYAMERLKSGDGYQSVVDAVKSAQTVAKKMILMNFVNTPEKPEINRTGKGTQNNKGHASITEAIVQVTQSGNLMRNGMLKIPCIHNGQPKVVTYYSETVNKMSGYTGMPASAIAVSFKPGMTIAISYSNEKMYGNEAQLIGVYKEGDKIPDERTATNSSTSTANESPVENGNDSSFSGAVLVKGEGKLLANGMIKVPCEFEGKPCVVVFSSNYVKNVCSGAGGTPEEFAKRFGTNSGKLWNVSGTWHDYNGEIQLMYNSTRKGA